MQVSLFPTLESDALVITPVLIPTFRDYIHQCFDSQPQYRTFVTKVRVDPTILTLSVGELPCYFETSDEYTGAEKWFFKQFWKEYVLFVARTYKAFTLNTPPELIYATRLEIEKIVALSKEERENYSFSTFLKDYIYKHSIDDPIHDYAQEALNLDLITRQNAVDVAAFHKEEDKFLLDALHAAWDLYMEQIALRRIDGRKRKCVEP